MSHSGKIIREKSCMEGHFSPISIVLEIKLNELMPLKH